MANRFVKCLILISFALIFAVGGKAQTDCGLTTAPKLNDFALGMSPAEAQAAIGNGLKIKVKQTGQRTFFQNFIKKRPPAALRGVRALYLRFLDGKLYQIDIFYEDRSDRQTLADLTAHLSARMNLPADLWQIEYNLAEINCDAFRLSANKILTPYVELTDKAARARVEAIRENDAK